MNFSRIIISCLVFSVYFINASNADRREPVCTDAQETAALTEASTLRSWDSVYNSFKRYRQCDDGAISEGYSDTVGRLLADDWQHFERLRELCSSDKDFQQFVLRHIDITVPVDVLQKIIDNARLRCSAKGKTLCRAIEDKASTGWNPKKN
jgi:hypothetical protein